MSIRKKQLIALHQHEKNLDGKLIYPHYYSLFLIVLFHIIYFDWKKLVYNRKNMITKKTSAF